jgi:acyl-CoA synthetase (AMP-forming)/AMP-acid ligase II
MTFNLADLFENAVDAFPDREYIAVEGERRSYAEMEVRANRLAHQLRAQGIGPGDHVGIYALNRVEWVESLWAIFKLRAVFININYRYVEEELSYIFDNADLAALIFERRYAAQVAAVRESMPALRHLICIDDDSDGDAAGLDAAEYEAAMAAGSPERDFAPRSDDDRYIIYTGGTTGMPKGVVWRHVDVFYAVCGGIDPYTGERARHPKDMIERGEREAAQVFLPIAPLMHGATQWSVISGSFVGRKVVLTAKFEPQKIWKLVAEEGVSGVMITGDAMGRPLVEALEEQAASLDLSRWNLLVSSAAVFSPTVKDRFFELKENLIIIDSIGSSESGNNGMAIITKGNTAMRGGGPTVKAGPGTLVLDESLHPLPPGSSAVGKVARGGDIPLEYYKDPVKTAETFVTIDGTRYAIPGDFARHEADGTITLLGRGSVSINSGGEKIYPEEVEQAVKAHPDIYDCVVVGVPDERFGSRVAAVVEPRAGREPTLASIQDHCRPKIAGYKLPRELHLVDRIERSPSGKPDYRWAGAIATRQQNPRE